MCGVIPPLPNTPSWCGAQLKHRDNFKFYRVHTGYVAHPALSPGVKRTGRAADHSHPFAADVKDEGRYTSTLTYLFTDWCLNKQGTYLHDVVLKHRDDLNLSPH
jgi:hypothetical protein